MAKQAAETSKRQKPASSTTGGLTLTINDTVSTSPIDHDRYGSFTASKMNIDNLNHLTNGKLDKTGQHISKQGGLGGGGGGWYLLGPLLLLGCRQ